MGGHGGVLEMPSRTTYWLVLKKTLKLDRSYAFLRTQDVGMDLTIELGAESLQFPNLDFYKKASTLTYSLLIVVVEGCRIIRILCQPLYLYPLLALSLIFGSDYNNIESTHICKF